MVGWWLVLYYPTVALLLLIGNKVADRYPNGSVVRDRTEMALGCGILALPGAPLILFIGSLIVRNPHEPIIQMIVAFGLFWLCTALIFGAMANFPWMQKAVAAICNRIRTLLSRH
jgi:hypothetical protein